LHLLRVKKNPATQKFFIRFSIERFIAYISFYVLSWPKLNFGCYLTFFKLYFNGKMNKKNLGCWIFFPAINATVFSKLRKKLFWTNKRFFQLLKQRKIRGENWGKQDSLFDVLFP
jgi:hypothetical protein